MLGKVIQGLVKSAIKNSINFELAIEPLITQLEESCPPREVIDKILTQKNQLTQALTQSQTALTTVTDTSSTLEDVLSGIQIAVKAIKFLPAPIPPFTPALVINTFSDSLDLLSTLLKEGKGTVKQITPAVKIISGNITNIQSKLSQLDNLIAGCLIGETEGLTNDEKEEFFNNLGINLSVGDINEDNLNANSNDPLVYKGFNITLDTNAGNKFSFPQRRAIAENKQTGQKLQGPFSYSSSTQVLIDAIKFEIDKITKPTLAEATNDIPSTPAPADPTPPQVPPTPSSSTIEDSGVNNLGGNRYVPFNGPGENLEVKSRGGKLWQYRASQKVWTDFYPNYSPFTMPGTFDSEVKQITDRDNFPVIRYNYKWSSKYYKWNLDSTEEL